MDGRIEDSYQFLTPENVEFSYEVAGLGSRFVAALVDGLIQSMLFLMVAVATLVGAGTALGLIAALSLPGQGTLVAWMVGGGLALLFLVLWGYYVFFEMIWSGQSPGKRVAHIRVIREDGYPIGFLESVVRNLVRVVDFLPAYYVIGTTIMLMNGRARRLGDYVAGTVVVKERSYTSLDQLTVRVRAGVEPGAPTVSGIAPQDYAVVREFLLRRLSIAAEPRRAVAAELAEAMAARLSVDRRDMDDEEFLEALAEGYAKR